jgi:superfamily II DNA or RNA helicase
MSVSKKVVDGNIVISAVLGNKLSNANFSFNNSEPSKELWSHQRDSLEAIRSAFSSGKTFGYVKHACATGKTRQIATVLAHSNLRALITAPTRDLAHQLVNDINADFPEVKAEYGIKNSTNLSRVNVITEGKLLSLFLKNHEQLNNLLEQKDLVILDEAHHYLGKNRTKLLNYLKIKCLLLGFTATDTYYTNKKLPMLLGEPLHTFSIQEASASRLIAPHKHLIATTNIDLSAVKVIGSDYDLRAISNALRSSNYVQDIVNYCHSNLPNQQVIVSVNALFQADTWIKYFSEKGYSAQVLHGRLDMTNRNRILTDFKEGRLDVLIGRKLVDTGVNCPSASVLIAEPTISRLRAEQRFGRIARLDPNNPQKVATIIDIYPQYFSPANMPIFFNDVLDNASNIIRASRKSRNGSASNNVNHSQGQKIIDDPNLVEALLERRSKQLGVYAFIRGKFVSHSEQAEFRKAKKRIIAKALKSILESPNYQDYIQEIFEKPKNFGLIGKSQQKYEIMGAITIIRSLQHCGAGKFIINKSNELPAIKEAKKFIFQSLQSMPIVTNLIFSEALTKMLMNSKDADAFNEIVKLREEHDKLRNYLIERFIPLVDILIDEVNDKKYEYEIRDLAYKTIFNFFNGSSKLASYRYYDAALVYLIKLEINKFYSDLSNKDQSEKVKTKPEHYIYKYDYNKEEQGQSFQNLIKFARKVLPRRSYQALEMRYLGSEVMSYEAIGSKLGVGKERVRQILLFSIMRLAKDSAKWI